MRAYELADPEERAVLQPRLVLKWHALFRNLPDDEKQAMADRFTAMLKLPVASPTRRAR
jgi:hypothetical protein